MITRMRLMIRVQKSKRRSIDYILIWRIESYHKRGGRKLQEDKKCVTAYETPSSDIHRGTKLKVNQRLVDILGSNDSGEPSELEHSIGTLGG